ncbi:MAG: ATP-binding cassette domain-containing protein [Lachnospiraceae bacterium]|nr:ATP-binding cassette domain-containing protein [Lachnospiraceae bacterium]
MALIVNIEKRIGDFHLKTAFEVEAGEIFGLLGESGCGKSMTLKCIAGIETPDRGRIILNNRILFDSERRINLIPQKRKVGYLFQDYALFPNMTVEKNIGIVLRKGERVQDYLEQFYLKGLENHYPFMLSGGQKQRCALARMMASKPELLLFDEPFSAVDKNLKWNLELQVLDLLDQMNKPAIFVTHNKDEIDHLCEKVGILSRGQMKEVGAKEDIFRHPKTSASAKLTGCENVFSVDGGSYSYVGIPQEAVKLTDSEADADITGRIERIFREKEETVLIIRMKKRIFYYRCQNPVPDRGFSVGDTIYLGVDKKRIWYLRES